jgi:hypothetical protein
MERISEFYAASDGTAFTSFDWWGSEEGIGSVGHRGWIAKKMGLGPIIVQYDAINEELIRDKDGLCVECEQGEIGEVLGPYDPTQPGQPFYCGFECAWLFALGGLTVVFDRGESGGYREEDLPERQDQR